MVEIQQAEKRPRGRPQARCDDDTRHLIVEAAAAEFQANGYAVTNMGTVAQRAGVSTKTLYRLVPTKAELFENVVKDRICRFMLAIDNDVVGGQDLAAGLERLLFAFGTLTLSDEVIALNRLVIGECDRFPEIARTFYLSAIVPVNGMLEGWLQRQIDQGKLQIADIHLASGILRGMMIMEPQRAAMLRQREAPNAAEIASRAKICAQLFLDGCRQERK
jgi:AcrR family transcriptional regulator